MASAQPRMVLRNVNAFVDRESQLGQASEVQVPLPKVKTETLRNAGMVKERKVAMGHEVDDMTIKFTSFDPAVLVLNGEKPGIEREFLLVGAHVDEDGTTHSTQAYIRGRMIEGNADAWQPGEKAENEFTITVDYCKITQDGQVIHEFDDFDYKLNGESQVGDITNALLI